MRTLTTDWNAAAYADAKTFCDRYAGTYVTIPAGTPVDSRSMADSVIGNHYYVLATKPDTLAVDSVLNAETVAIDADVDVVLTVTKAPTAVSNIRVTALSSDPTVVTVDAAYKLTDANGQVTFTLTGIAEGGDDVTFQVASDVTLEQVVAVTVPAA